MAKQATISPLVSGVFGPYGGNRELLDDTTVPLKFILTEKEKYKDNKKLVKRIFRHYESIGEFQTRSKAKEIRKLYNLAYGRINREDYVEVDEDFSAATGIEKAEDFGLEFYPIIPTIHKGILGAKDKMYSEYTAQAVNAEATNDLLKQLDNALRDALISNLEEMFMAASQGMPVEEVEQRRKLLLQTEEAKHYQRVTYRSTVEEWAQHRMNIEDQMFGMSDIEREVLEQLIVTEDPTIHIDFDGKKYRPEVLREKDTFCLRKTSSKDYSNSLMFGWFDYCTFADILNLYGSKLTTDEVERIGTWSQQWQGESFIVDGMLPRWGKYQGIQENAHNLKVLESVLRRHYPGSDGSMDNSHMAGDYVRVSTIYFYIPRKYGQLTVKNIGDPTITELVDESFEITLPTVYEPGKKKSAETLISGEHVDWFYRPELWRGKKVSSWGFNPSGAATYKDSEIWIELDRFEIQYEDPHEENGLYIPVHGGPITNQFNDSASLVKIAAPWQIQFNWIHNRNKQLAATEIGKYFAADARALTPDSLEGTFSEGGIATAAAVARDTHLMPMGATTSDGRPIQTGSGQVVDLTNTKDILDKFTLANLIEAACYRSVGLTPEFLLGDMSPHQSAKSAALGQQRTVTQLQNLFTRVNQIMTKARTTMLHAAQYIAVRKPNVEMSYNTPQGARVLFRTSTEEFSLHRLGVFVKSNAADLAVIESIKQYVAQNNTMGANSYEMATLMAFKSLPELFRKLQEIQYRKDEEIQQQREHERLLQEQQIQAAQAQMQAEINAKSQENALDRDKDVMVAQIKALGYAQDDAAGIQEAILKLQDANQKQKQLYAQSEAALRAQAMKESQQQFDFAAKSKQLDIQERLALKNTEQKDRALQQKDRELDIREKDIAARNSRTKAID